MWIDFSEVTEAFEQITIHYKIVVNFDMFL